MEESDVQVKTTRIAFSGTALILSLLQAVFGVLVISNIIPSIEDANLYVFLMYCVAPLLLFIVLGLALYSFMASSKKVRANSLNILSFSFSMIAAAIAFCSYLPVIMMWFLGYFFAGYPFRVFP